MLVEEPRDNELNLEKIDMEIRMERIRQNAAKLSWDGFGHAVRRNLLEKRVTFDADGRLDVLNAIAYMKKKIPVDENATIAGKIKQLADSLECSLTAQSDGFFLRNSDVTIEIGCIDDQITSCKIGYWEEPLFDADEVVKLLRNGEFGHFRSSVFGVIGILPSNVSPNVRQVCKKALYQLEQHLGKDSSDSSYSAINTSKHGFFCPRTPLRPGRIYFIAEPMYVKSAQKSHADMQNLECLPHVEISFVANETALQLFGGQSVTEAHACVCIRFSHAMLFSAKTMRKMEKYIAKSPLIRHYTNQYRYMCGKDKVTENFQIVTKFPDGYAQHKYDIDVECMTKENDPVLVEFYIKDLNMLGEIISILRSEWMHNSLWESMLAMCHGPKSAEETVSAIDMKTLVSRKRFEFVFATTENGLVNVQISEQENLKWSVKCVLASSGESIDEQLDQKMTDVLMSSWSVPCALSLFVSKMECSPSPISSESIQKWKLASEDEENDDVKMETNDNFGFDKVGRAWLTQKQLQHLKEVEKMGKEGGGGETTVTEAAKKSTTTTTKLPKYSRQKDHALRGGLLAMFAEVDESLKPAPKLKRYDSTQMGTFSDLDRIRMLSEADLDNRTPPPLMLRTQLSMTNSVGGGSAALMSPLETARLQMKQSMGAATAVALANNACATPTTATATKEMFDFGTDDYASSSSQLSSPTYSFIPAARGGGAGAAAAQATAKTRRPRGARKPGNIGERSGSSPAQTASAHAIRGGGAMARRSRGGGANSSAMSRKSSEVGMEQQHNNKPHMLNRSFSDFPDNAMQTISPSVNYGDEESDDECDPPPPPKQMLTPRPNLEPSSSSSPSIQQDIKPDINVLKQQMMMKESMMAPSLTPEVPNLQPATAPPKLKEERPAAPTTTTKKKGIGLEAAISKIKTAQQAQLQQQQQAQQAQNTPNRASSLSDIFDDGLSSPSPIKTEPSKIGSNVLLVPKTEPEDVNNKLTVTMEPKMVLKIPKISRNSPSVDQQLLHQQKPTPPPQLAASTSSSSSASSSYKMSGMPKLEKQEKKSRKDREKVSDRKEKESSSSSKKRKLEKKEKEPKEPREKKSKTSDTHHTNNPVNIMPTLSLKNFRIPKKEADGKEDTASTSASTSASANVKERDAPPAPTLSRKSSFTSTDYPPSNFGAFEVAPPSRGRKKLAAQPPPPPPPQKRKPLPPPLARGMYAPIMRGYPPQSGGPPPPPPPSYYQNQKTVASYAQGIPPGSMPYLAAGGGGGGGGGGQWVRPPLAREMGSRDTGYHSSNHSSSSSSSYHRNNDRHNDDNGPESPEETLRIADE